MAKKPAYGPRWPQPSRRTYPPPPRRSGKWVDAAREQKKPFDTVAMLAAETKNPTVGQQPISYEPGI